MKVIAGKALIDIRLKLTVIHQRLREESAGYVRLWAQYVGTEAAHQFNWKGRRLKKLVVYFFVAYLVEVN
jgi:hypothetical protein